MKLWDKGFSTNEKIDIFTVGSDRELDLVIAEYDTIASMAHARMLAKIGLLEQQEADQLVVALEAIRQSILKGEFIIDDSFEDVHSKIEYILTEKLGDTGKKIHTARSRNDQVLVAIQLYLKHELKSMVGQVSALFITLMDLSEKHKNILLPGYTHLQIAMPSSFGLWFSAYAESLIDDVHFLNAAIKCVDQNPMGSAAGYGSSFPIDREFTTQILEFETLKYNVVAAQMGRGKTEKSTAFAMSSVAGTLSKMAMDICLYMSQNFDFISFPDELTTGSSIMPHKKNPDVFELIRGKCNKVQSLPNTLTMLQTNLPSGYHRDMQLTKEILVPGIQELKSCLELLNFSIQNIRVNKDILSDKKYDYLFSVDTLNDLVMQGLPFRDAYKKMGMEIQEGTFEPKRDIKHVHLGSLGNPGFDQIRIKMQKALDSMN
ncbi:argininosuccinate lyase [Robertkochia solimangrovi]|uniref:argininosuccinate lyase n=1 Tax=Robertkochia solimangrovi TaxID=2213046 RepID=UPI00118106A9|nr:argininosuccinate lyase [Robertkochia solimangrovi]TRZ42537.1 argininosuccinate lyase [Robertkochia solimangrovi]